jgi:hypothetical protein
MGVSYLEDFAVDMRAHLIFMTQTQHGNWIQASGGLTSNLRNILELLDHC